MKITEEPSPRWSKAACVIAYGARTLIAHCASSDATGDSGNGFGQKMPAEWTIESIRPKRVERALHDLLRRAVGRDVERQGHGCIAAGGGRLGESRGVAAHEHDARARLRHRLGDGRADARARARHDGDLAVEPEAGERRHRAPPRSRAVSASSIASESSIGPSANATP